LRILVVDDAGTYRLILHRALVERGHECLLARDGKEGLALFAEHEFDVVISDWQMNEMDGDELVRALRSQPAGRELYVLMLTSLDDDGSRRLGVEAGADDVLSKPLDFYELERRLIAAQRFADLRADAQQDLSRARELLTELAARAGRYGHSYWVALFKVDAEDPLKRGGIAECLRQACRSGDGVLSCGPGGVLLVLPEQTDTSAYLATKRLLGEAVQTSSPGGGGARAGLARVTREDERRPEEILDRLSRVVDSSEGPALRPVDHNEDSPT